ncbi:Major facilitator superfamily domain, general substrate transporter [Pseudocohnilembus persalinus]|uniref:Major facilitator superfamily domain, general substrate transporter n=1 Tax=Pseudocohnilembus persalinus TaxID=266149 RepID=A0A0V0QWD5_PSEPJ|nr:Major facilitator superfamily domain, general substrate transporter [Pseudocohnilembus persalinus]|eukprot:KRX06567.1 Major facilitator superfamily domain, general substrate transporter [Pseudocohnilembus persalinus]
MIFSFLIMGMPLLFEQPIFECLDTTDNSYFFCSQTEACDLKDKLEDKNFDTSTNPPFKIVKHMSADSLALDFELYCEKKYLISLCGSVFFIGAALAGFIFAQMAQQKGRKKAILYSIALGGLSLFLAGFSQSIYQFIFLIFFSGVGLNGFETLSLVYVTEISAENFRNFSGVILTTGWAIAQIIYSCISYYITSWRYICIFMIGIPFLVTYYFSQKILLETPRFLVSKQKYQEARDVLSQISQINKRPRFEYKIEGEQEEQDLAQKLLEKDHNEEQQQDIITPEKQSINYTFIDLFRYKSIRNITISMLFLWIFRYITYFGQSFSLSSLGAEMHSNMIRIGISETVACLIAGPIKLKLKRIQTMMLFTFITSVCCILTIIIRIPDECYLPGESCIQKGLQVIFAQAIKFSITIFLSILITYTSEVFPTVVRSLGYGLCMTAGKGGTIFMPFIVSYFELEGLSPLIVFGFFGLFVVFLIFRLPETKDVQMKDFLEEQNQTDKPILELDDLNLKSYKEDF